MAITNYHIQTSMGKITSFKENLPFLSEEEVKEFNLIGYTGKNSKGEKTNYQEYLNSLGKGEFLVEKTKSDNGEFIEEFTVTRVY